MDPSYTNSVQNGGVSGGEALGGRPGVSDGMNVGAASGVSGAPAGPIISSGDGSGMNTANVAVAAPAPRRRWPWVVIGALVVVAVVVGVVAVVVNQNGGSDLRTAFNRMANYAIFGESTTSNVTISSDTDIDYYFLTHQETKEEQAALYAEFSNLLDDFLKVYNGRSDEKLPVNDKDSFRFAVQDLNDLFAMMRQIYTKEVPGRADLQQSYLEADGQAANAMWLSYYGNDDEDNEYIHGFLEAYRNWVNSEFDIMNFYDNNGCIIDGVVWYECVIDSDNVELLDAFNELLDLSKNYRADMFYYDNQDFAIISDIFQINDIFNNRGYNMEQLEGGDEIE